MSEMQRRYESQGSKDLGIALAEGVAVLKNEGRVMSQVMSHVGYWLNGSPAIIGDRENNKGPLRKDFLPALTKRYGDEADRESILLQKEVLSFSRNRFKDFTDIVCDPFLNQFSLTTNMHIGSDLAIESGGTSSPSCTR